MTFVNLKNNKVILTIATAFIVIVFILPIVLSSIVLIKYFQVFDGGLSLEQDVWGQFGDLVGGILNPALSYYALVAAMIAIGYQLYEGKRSRAITHYQIFESTFFKLIDIQSKKIEMLDYDGEKGLVVFTRLTSRFSEVYINKIQQRFLKEKPPVFQILVNEWLANVEMSNYGQECAKVFEAQPGRNKVELITEVLAKYNMQAEESIFANVSSNTRTRVIEEFLSQNAFDHFIEDLDNTCDDLYRERGHIYGHYFRNMSMLLDHVSSYDEAIGNKFAKLYRAQLSRAELAMLVINCVGRKSSRRFNRQVLKYDLMNGFEEDDIVDGHRIHEHFNRVASQ